MGAGVRVGESGGDIIAAENWRCRWKKSCGVVVGGEVRDCHCPEDVLIRVNKHGSFGRYDRRTSSAFPHPLCSWPQLYLLASALSIFSRLGGGFFTRWMLFYIRLFVYILPLAFPSHPCPARYSIFLLLCKSVIMPPSSCDYSLCPHSLTQRHERPESIPHLPCGCPRASARACHNLPQMAYGTGGGHTRISAACASATGSQRAAQHCRISSYQDHPRYELRPLYDSLRRCQRCLYRHPSYAPCLTRERVP